MLLNGTVSIVREGAEENVLIGTYSAWVRLKEKTENTDKGRKKACVLSARIPELNIPVEIGDYISPCELNTIDIIGLYLITAIKLNTFGGSPHIYIEAELN